MGATTTELDLSQKDIGDGGAVVLATFLESEIDQDLVELFVLAQKRDLGVLKENNSIKIVQSFSSNQQERSQQTFPQALLGLSPGGGEPGKSYSH